MARKYDPLWERVGEQIPLEGTFEDVDSKCPVCHVTVHLGHEASAGEKKECGLCGSELEVTQLENGELDLVTAGRVARLK